MNIMIIGGTGFIGTAITRALTNRGHSALSMSRSVAGPDMVQVDRANAQNIADISEQYNIETVIDVIGYTESETLPLIHALDGCIARYVLLSSADVYRNYGLLNRAEEGTASARLDESSPLRMSRYPYRGTSPRSDSDPQKWMDEYDKIPLEMAVQTLNTDWTILRLPMLYGPGDKQRRFRWLVEGLRSNPERLVLPEAWLNWTTSYGFVENIGDAIALAAIHPSTTDEILNLIDYSPVSHRKWIERFARAMNWRGSLEVTSDPNHPIAIATHSLDLSVPLVMTADKITTRLSYIPPMPIENCIEKTLEAEMETI